MTVREFLLRHRRTAAGAALGAVAGALYAHFIGCQTGTCILTSSVRAAALFFGFMGAVVALPGPARDRGPVPPPRAER